MQVNSVSSAQTFKSNNVNPAAILAFASDRDLQQIAYAKTLHDVNDKKHRRIDKALFASIPIAAGIAAAVTPAKAARIDRLISGSLVTAGVTASLAVIGAAFGLRNKIDENSETAAKFSRNYPLLSVLATSAAAFAGIVALNKGSNKILNTKFANDLFAKLEPTLEKLGKKLDASKVLDFTSKQLAKLPSAFKEITKTALKWSPIAIIGTQIVHDINHDRVKTKEYYNNFAQLKTAQNAIRESLQA